VLNRPLQKRKAVWSNFATNSMNCPNQWLLVRYYLNDNHCIQCLCLLLSALKRSYTKAEFKLQEERATLTRFDDELKDLEIVINQKKDDINTADLRTKELDHECKALNKEKTAASNIVVNLEKQYEWILEECE
jgi:septal ring factor EnvC (AmiA/AmiB activator)